jgi:hypothetical protein
MDHLELSQLRELHFGYDEDLEEQDEDELRLSHLSGLTLMRHANHMCAMQCEDELLRSLREVWWGGISSTKPLRRLRQLQVLSCEIYAARVTTALLKLTALTELRLQMPDLPALSKTAAGVLGSLPLRSLQYFGDYSPLAQQQEIVPGAVLLALSKCTQLMRLELHSGSTQVLVAGGRRDALLDITPSWLADVLWELKSLQRLSILGFGCMPVAGCSACGLSDSELSNAMEEAGMTKGCSLDAIAGAVAMAELVCWHLQLVDVQLPITVGVGQHPVAWRKQIAGWLAPHPDNKVPFVRVWVSSDDGQLEMNTSEGLFPPDEEEIV